MKSENNKLIKITILCVLVLVAIASVSLLYFRPLLIRAHLPKPVKIDTTHQPTLGNPNAKIHIVVFEDLKCVNCARFNNTVMPYIKKRYIDPGRAKYTMINLAFISGSLPAANTAHCIYMQNPASFFDFVDMIFHNQPPEEQNWATIPALMTLAAKIQGMNTDQLASCMIDNTYAPLIENNLKQAMKLMNQAVETPAIYVNGIRVSPATKAQLDLVIWAVIRG